MQPIVDLKPNDLLCVYSTLVYIIKELEKLNIKMPTVTFDQPLYSKATSETVHEDVTDNEYLEYLMQWLIEQDVVTGI